MPKRLCCFSMVEAGGDLYIVGGEDKYGNAQKLIHKLSCSFRECKWTTLDKQLKDARTLHVTIPLMESYCTPQNKNL